MDTSSSDDMDFTKSGSRKMHICKYPGCNKQFGKPSRLLNHERIHNGERPYKCDHPGCQRSYTRQQHLSRHIDVSHSSSKVSDYLRCDLCDKEVKNKYNLQKHMTRFHIKQKFQCPDCDKSFLKQQHLKTHSYIHTGVKPYKCEFEGCNKSFEFPNRLKTHAQIHNPLRYKCERDGCQEAFTFYQDLRTHVQYSHPPTCDICQKPFHNIAHLRKHRQTHSDVREAYFCLIDQCGRCYYEERNLKKHIEEFHHKTTTFKCDTCGRFLSTKQKLAYHIKTHSPDYEPKKKPKSTKPRRPRKDKGIRKNPLANLLSGFPANKTPSLEDVKVSFEDVKYTPSVKNRSGTSESQFAESNYEDLKMDVNSDTSDEELESIDSLDFSDISVQSSSGISVNSCVSDRDISRNLQKVQLPDVELPNDSNSEVTPAPAVPYQHIKGIVFEDM